MARTPVGLTAAVRTGNRVRSLEALRDKLAQTIESAPEYAVAALSKQLADVMRELDQLNPPKTESTLDDLAARRAARRKDAEVSKRAASGKQRRTRGGRTPRGGGPTA